MDISTGKSVAQREDEGTTIHVRDQSGEKLYADDAQTEPVTITVAGSYSRRFRRAADALRDKNMKRRRTTVDGEAVNRDALELVAACVIAWDGFTTNGEPFVFTRANAIALFDEFPWIREQVESAINDHSLFSQAPSPVSLSA